MSFGLHSTVLYLQARLVHRWVPKWQSAFTDPATCGFYERLNPQFKPIFTGQRRLVGQCRQLSIYSHALAHFGIGKLDPLKQAFSWIERNYHDPATGLWWFSLDDANRVKERVCDLYAMAFVIFSLSHYGRATGDAGAHDHALKVLKVIQTAFRVSPLKGFAEALDENGVPIKQMRRQNPHMHLLEACLFAHDVWGDDDFLAIADEIVSLFQSHFWAPDYNCVIEFFDETLMPHGEHGKRTEPGHAFEWVWLLKKYAARRGGDQSYNQICLSLLHAANQKGWDHLHDGIYDEIAMDGTVLKDTKRLWPFCEAMKANALLLNHVPDRQDIKDRLQTMIALFLDDYIDARGFWTEWLTRTRDPATDYMPSTTPYHVYFGITETAAALDARGAAKSILLNTRLGAYAATRQISQGVQSILKAKGGDTL